MAFLGFTGMLYAEPRPYALDRSESSVNFFYTLNGDDMRGSMPVQNARIILDLSDLRRSDVYTELNARQVRTGFFLLTEALRGERALETSRYPLITFQSTGFRRRGERAIVDGMLTLRDITRPVSLEARLYRRVSTAEATGSDPDNALWVLLTGVVSRSAFGADGYAELVGDRIRLEIQVRLLPQN